VGTAIVIRIFCNPFLHILVDILVILAKAASYMYHHTGYKTTTYHFYGDHDLLFNLSRVLEVTGCFCACHLTIRTLLDNACDITSH